jgi:hypothetical protein
VQANVGFQVNCGSRWRVIEMFAVDTVITVKQHFD